MGPYFAGFSAESTGSFSAVFRLAEAMTYWALFLLSRLRVNEAGDYPGRRVD